MNIIGLIPARAGSKGVENKNIRDLNGKPLVAYTIEAALQSKLLSRVIVSTDESRIAEIAKGLGAEAPFLRPEDLAGDDVPDLPVMKHAVEWLEKEEGYRCDFLVYLRPTTPFKTGLIIDAAIEKMMSNEAYSGLRTVVTAEGAYHPYWMYKEADNFLVPFIDGLDRDRYYQRQLLPPCFRLNGVVDIVRGENIAKGVLYGEKVAYHELTEAQSLDIDTEHDFKITEFLMKG